MHIPSLEDYDVSQKRILLRADLDFDLHDQSNFRFRSLIPTLDFLKEKGCQIILMGHRGRPEGKADPNLSLMPFKEVFAKWGVKVLENLRFDPREEVNDEVFARELSAKGDFFVNEAFAVSHRAHASIVGVPKFLPHVAGLRFVAEVENLGRVRENPVRPLVVIISGVKQDKLSYVEAFLEFADKILIGGRLPEFIHDVSPLRRNPKVVVGSLIVDKEDISMHTIETFETEIAQAKTILVSGPLGKFEDPGHTQGTKRILQAVSQTSAFKVAGGGETLAAVKTLALGEKFDWLSVGGGAMLEFLAKSTLVGIEALFK